MTFDKAELYAKRGKILMLPKWVGYFSWDYTKNEIQFNNGDYHLNRSDLSKLGIFNRKDWYYII